MQALKLRKAFDLCSSPPAGGQAVVTCVYNRIMRVPLWLKVM